MAIASTPPHVLVLHVELLGAEFEVWDSLKTDFPKIGFVAMAPTLESPRLVALAEHGAKCFISERESDYSSVRAAIRSAAQGEPWLPSPVASLLLDQISMNGHQKVTIREREILGLVACGFTDEEIGRRLFLSHHSVKKRVKLILEKLGARNRTEAAVRAILVGLCELPVPGQTLKMGSRSPSPPNQMAESTQ